MSPATRERVLEAIDEVGYRPNLAARSLVTRRTSTIGLVTGALTDPFFAEIAHGVIRAARQLGYTVLLSATDDDLAAQKEIFNSLASHGVDALIVFPVKGTEPVLKELARGGLSIVVVDADPPSPAISSVASDLRTGASMATRALLDGGKKELVMLANARSSRQWREEGFQTTVESAGATGSFHRALPTLEGGRSAMRDALAARPNLDGVFAYNDLMAMGALEVLHEAGRAIPSDVAVVGFDDIPMIELTDPPLSTIRLNRTRVGEESLRQAIDLSQGGDPERLVIPVEFVPRQTI